MCFIACLSKLHFLLICFLAVIKVKIFFVTMIFSAICVVSIIFTFISNAKVWQMEKLSFSTFMEISIANSFYGFYGWFYLFYWFCSFIHPHSVLNLYFIIFLTCSLTIKKLVFVIANICDYRFYLMEISCLCFCSLNFYFFKSTQAYAFMSLVPPQSARPLMYCLMPN